MEKELIDKVGELGVKMRIYKARLGGNTDTADINDRQTLILQMIDEQKRVSVFDICQTFKEVGQSTISMDIALFRKKKWTQKTLSNDDERVHFVELTNEGKKKVREIRNTRNKTYLPLVKAIGNNSKEIQVLQNVIDRVIEELDKELASQLEKTN